MAKNIDNILVKLVDDWATFMLHGESPDGANAIKAAKQALYSDLLELSVGMFDNITIKPHQPLNEALNEKFDSRLKEYFGVE